ncbi:MAG TPA: DUF2169 domain-containing protein [Polyangiaceae bacterium]|nr:DUF2169 domain-containing protein [Polyangiaceae bacterium]
MQIANSTPAQIRLLKSSFPPDPLVYAAAIVKLTFEIGADGRTAIASEQMPLQAEFLETPHGVLHGDMYPKKRGVDVCVFATVQCSRPTTQTMVWLTTRERRVGLRVTGNRHWQVGTTGDPVPSAPEPFTNMPLTYANAYGGLRQEELGLVAFPDNPHGKGALLRDARDSLGKPLPNIEPAEGPFVSRWNDVGVVAGFGPYPMVWGLRAREGVEVNLDAGEVEGIRPSLFNHAHPSLVLNQCEPGDVIVLEGAANAASRLSIPRVQPKLDISVGENQGSLLPGLDGVFWWVSERRLVLTYRGRFQYGFVREEPRRAELTLLSQESS